MAYQAKDQDSSGKHFEKKEEKVQHDLKCGNCGDPAEVNYQLIWVSWDITLEGGYINQEFHQEDRGEFWCSRCWELDRAEEYDKLEEIREKFHANNKSEKQRRSYKNP